jgi:hypothetical protein
VLFVVISLLPVWLALIAVVALIMLKMFKNV